MSADESLVRAFDGAMFDIYRRAKSEAKYNATVFLRMLTERGGLATAKALVNAPNVSEGYGHLYERGRLDLTVEALIVENVRWSGLFDESELDRAHSRLKQYGYTPRFH